MMLVRIFPGNPQPHGVTQIDRNGLDQDVRVDQEVAGYNESGSNLINTISVWLFWGLI